MDDQSADCPDEVEEARLRALRSLHVLDTGQDPRFDGIVRTAALILRAPFAAIALIDEDRLWYKARFGFEDVEAPRRQALGDFTARQKAAVVIPDVRSEPALGAAQDRLKEIGVRFLAVAPLVTPGGHTIGTLSVLDPAPHGGHTEVERQALEDLAVLTMDLMLHDAATFEAEQRAAQYQQRLELALEAAGLGEFEWDIPSDRIVLSERLSKLAGGQSTGDATVDRPTSLEFVHPEDRLELRAVAEQRLASGGRFSAEFRLNPTGDGRTRWMHCEGLAVRDANGAPTTMIGVVRDISEQKAAEEHRELLLNELDHRVKNMLAAVQAMAAQTARRTTSVDSFLTAFAGRLKAMASAHELLTATRWRGASLADLVAAELGGLAPGQTRWEGAEIMLGQHGANIISLALHELATNAVKYGALSVDAGRVEVIWKPRPAGGFILRWTELGGPLVATPQRSGFGTKLLKRIIDRDLGDGSRIEYRADGLAAVLEVGASAVAARAEGDAGHAIETPPPAEAATARPSPEPHPNGRGIEGLRVLIVEDAILLALELEAGLVEAGAVIVGNAASRDEAISMLDREIDVAVLDANLNGDSIAPAAEILQARGIPFIFATGYGERGAPEGFDVPVVRKPYNVQQIIRALADAIGHHADV